MYMAAQDSFARRTAAQTGRRPACGPLLDYPDIFPLAVSVLQSTPSNPRIISLFRRGYLNTTAVKPEYFIYFIIA